MTGGSIRVEGAANLRRTLKKAGYDVKKFSQVNRAAAQVVASASKSTAPKRTGRLAASIRAGATQKAGVIRAGRKTVPYANPIHWGWFKRGIRPNPWLSRTAQATEPQWRSQYERHMDDIVKSIKGL